MLRVKVFLFLLLAGCYYVLPAQSNITAVEYFFDSDPGVGNGTAVSITPAVALTNFSFDIDISSLSNGFHSVFLRAKDGNEKWSLTFSQPFYKLSTTTSVAAANISKLEYFIDADPGFGVGTDIPITPGLSISNQSFAVPLSAVANGFHSITVRAQDANNKWGVSYSEPFYKLSAAAATPIPNVVKIEYFIDADPGFGLGTGLTITPGVAVTNQSFTVPLSSVTNGFHSITVRAEDANNKWSTAYTQPFFKLASSTVAAIPNLEKLEYFIDADPGLGLGIDVPVTAGTTVSDLNVSIPLSSVAEGNHLITFRARDANENWSIVTIQNFSLCNFAPTTATAVTNVTSTGFTANWSAVSGATGYVLDVSADNFTTFVSGYNAKSVSLTSQAVTGLTANTVYQMRARSVGNCTSINSNVITATTATAAPVASAATAITAIGFTANWAAVTGATSYEVDVSTDSFSTFVTNYNSATASGTSLAVTGLTPSSSYQYRVRAVNAGGASANSYTIYLNTSAAALAAPVAIDGTSVSTSGFTANWNTVTDATGYQVDVSTASDFSSFVTDYNSATASGTSLAITGLTAATVYYYQVRAIDADGTSVNSNVITVTTPAQAQAQTITFGPLANVTVGTSQITLTATASSGLAVIYTSSDNTIATVSGSTLTIVGAGSCTITADQAGNSDFSAAAPVSQTFCANPAQPTITLSGANSVSPTLTSSAASGNQWFLDGAAVSGATNSTFSVSQVGTYTVQVSVGSCQSAMSANEVLIVTGDIKSNSTSEGINLYPNPAKSLINISLENLDANESVNIQVFDMLGHNLQELSAEGGSTVSLDIANYAQGSYLIRATQSGNLFHSRFAKQ